MLSKCPLFFVKINKEQEGAVISRLKKRSSRNVSIYFLGRNEVMSKKITKITSCLLCLAMLLSMAAPALAARADDDAVSIEAPAIAEDGGTVLDVDSFFEEVPAASLSAADENPFITTGEYEIYPTPHSVTYPGGTVALPATMKVTYGAGIDQYTKARAAEAFEQAEVTLDENAADATVQLRVSIKADGDGVTSTTAGLFAKTSAYKLTIDASGVTVVGVDTDAAFYGLTTVKRILQQVDKTTRSVKCLTVEDYADVPFRGFIEGYYGNPWTTEDREALMAFGGELKMNIYFYAPKDDPKHNAKWRELYTPEELEQKIQPLAEAGNKSKCYFGYALHPFMNYNNRLRFDDNYDADLEVLKAKFTQVIKAGVRQIAVLADDLTTYHNTGTQYAQVMTDLTEWVSSDAMQEQYPGLKVAIPFCPEGYMNNGSNAELQQLKAGLPDSVPVIMTGGQVWGHVEHSFLNTYRSNMGTGPFMWVNWPCSDNSKTVLTMGGHDSVLQDDLTAEDIAAIKGIMLNPMQQSEPSKAAIFQNADYAWNIWTSSNSAERTAKVWNDCFKYVDHDSAIETETSAALRELSKHMIHQYKRTNGSYPKYDESIELAPQLTAFLGKLDVGTLTADEVRSMREEFQKLYDAAVLYKGKTEASGNTRILGQRNPDGTYVDKQEQMAPWLDTWEDFTSATLDLLDALALSLDNANGANNSDLLEKYLSGQSKLEASRKHGFFYVNYIEYANVGGQHLIPFVNELLTKVAAMVNTILTGVEEPLKETIITNRTDNPRGGLDAVRDGDEGTDACFKDPNTIRVDDYVGVQFNQGIELTSLKFVTGAIAKNDGGSANDRFNNCKLQYKDEAGAWQDIPNATFNHDTCEVMEVTGLNLTVRGVRAIATSERTGTWFGIKEIYINGESGTTAPPAEDTSGPYDYTATLHNLMVTGTDYDLDKMADGKLNTVTRLKNASGADNCPKDGYIQLDLGSPKPLGVISLTGDSGATGDCMNVQVQYLDESGVWHTIAIDNVDRHDGDFSIDVSKQNITAQTLAFVITEARNKWWRIAELSVSAPVDDYEKIAYQSDVVKSLVEPRGVMEDTSATLSAGNVILRSGEFVGIALPRICTITEITANYTPAPGLVLKVGMNDAEMEVVNLNSRAAYSGDARYIRLENAGAETVSFQLDELSAQWENTSSGITYVSAHGCQPESASDDPLAWFDGDINTRAKFAYAQNVDNWVLYDLGQTRSISSLRATIINTDPDYPRNGVWELSASQDGPWETVLTITTTLGEGQDDYNNPPSTNKSTEWQQATANYIYQENTLEQPVSGRYLRYRVTSASRNYLRFNEITINGGEYVSAFSDPAFTVDPAEISADNTPDKLVDGDLTTAFIPDMEGRAEDGSLIYRVSGDTSIGQINVVSGSGSSAKLLVRPAGETQFQEVGSLSGGLSEVSVPERIANVAEIKLSWASNVSPSFYELVTIPREQVTKAGGQAPSEVETIPINSYSGDARKISFDENWKFNLGDISGAEALAFNDAAWETINLPHDFSIDQNYTTSGEAESAYLLGGTGWYRKSFTISQEWRNNKVVSIDFGGAYMETDVYLNGHKLGENKNGYNPFSFVLPAEHLNYTGENVIAVKVVNRVPSSRWYSGSGIYRSVDLTVTSPVHVARYGTFVNPVKGSGNDWTVNIKTDVQNDTASAANVTVEQAIYELNPNTYEKGTLFAQTTSAASANPEAGASASVEQTISVQNPKLWYSWDKGEGAPPNLYVLVTTVKQDGTEVDTYETEFGFRTIEFTTDVGFKLNGVNTKLKGVCQHHDQGALGAEGWYRAMERQVEILMDMGCNSIRVTHNPADDKLIEICNRKGILIIDEAFDCWTKSKNGNSNDFARFFYTPIASDNAIVGGEGAVWSQFVLQTMVNRDKNAPCVIMYSLGNEILSGAGDNDNPSYIQIIQDLVGWKEAIDTVRPVTMGDDSRTTGVSNDATTNTAGNVKAYANTYLSKHGVVGFNYCNTRDRDVMGTAHNNDWVMYGSETASHVNSRGVYYHKSNNTDGQNDQGAGLLTSYDKSRVGWGDTAAGAWWYTVRFDYNMGEYVWTGFDYLGEPTPYNWTGSGKSGYWHGSFETAAKSSYFGIIDTNGIPKDNYYLYRAMWNETDTTLHVLPTWDEADLLLDSERKAEVVAYTNAPVVRVYLNGVEVGAAKADETTTPAGHKYRVYKAAALQNGGTNTFTPGSEAHSGAFTGTALYSTFMVPYAAGTLEVKAFESETATDPIPDTVGRSVVRTTDRASKLAATADRSTIKNDGKDLSYVTIDVLDGKNEIVNGATNEVTVSVSGDGKFMGLDNGVQPDHTPYLSKTRKAGAGRLVAIIQSTKEAGTFTVTATSPGLSPATVTVSTGGATAGTGDDAPVSYELSKTIYVQLNTPPTLPETTTVTLGNGTQVTKDIHWPTYDADLLAVPGEFSITGTIDGYNTTVSVNIVVLDDIAALLNYSTTVPVGQTPTLPAGRPAVMADGTVVAAQFKVTWQRPDDSVYDQAGTVVVNGTAEVFGKTYNVTATVRVAAPEYTEGGEALVGTTVYENSTIPKGILADLNPAYGDHNTATAIKFQGDIGYFFDTAQNIYKFELTYQGTPPNGGVTLYYAGKDYPVAEAEDSWQAFHPTRTVNGSTVTYQLAEPCSSLCLKFSFANEVNLAEIKLTTGLAVYPVGSTAKLDDLEINGDLITSEQKTSGLISTSATMANLRPISDDNVALTILPETSDSKVIIVTESEDHNERFKYVIQLNDMPEYPYDRTEANAESQQNHAQDSNDGPASEVADNDPDTYWHTNWGGGTGTVNPTDLQKRYIELKLDAKTPVIGLRYLPRSNVHNGTVTSYEVWVSPNETVTTGSQAGFTKVAEGDWEQVAGWKTATFDAVEARYVRLYGVHTYGDSNRNDRFMSCAELRVLYQPTEIDLSEGSVTVSPDTFDWKFGNYIRPGEGDEHATVTVTVRGKELTLGQDYTLDYRNHKDPGTATLIVRAKSGSNYRGSVSTTFQIVKPDLKIVSFAPITVRTQAGKPPVLPDTVEAVMNEGSHLSVPVTWEDVPESNYILPSINTYTVHGTTDEYPVEGDIQPTITVEVHRSTSVDTISMVTALGVEPTLPTEVTVQFADGSSDVRPIDEWDTSALDIDTPGIYTITGTVVNIAKKATISLRVADADAPTTWVPGDTNIALSKSGQTLPLAMASYSSNNDLPANVIDGKRTGNVGTGKLVWNDWQQNTFHTNPWVAIVLDGTLNGNTYTPATKKVNKVSIGFFEENAIVGPGKVAYPVDYEIQYYTRTTPLTFDTSNYKRVSEWSNSPLMDDANWTTVTPLTGEAKPEPPNITDNPNPYTGFMDYTFQPVDAAIIRVKMTPDTSRWVGIEEFKVYEAVAVPAANDDFTVQSITLGGEEKLSGFTVDANDPNTYVLEVLLDEEATTAPELAITVAPNDNASVSVTQAARIDGAPEVGAAWAQASVTSEDGSKTVHYIVKFSHRGGASGYFLTLNVTDATRADKVVLTPDHGAYGDTVTIQPTPGYELVNPLARITSGPNINLAVTITNGQFTIPAGDVLVTTGVQPITYTLTYLDCGSARPGPGSYNVENSAFTLTQPTKAGYTFLGWIGGGLTVPTKDVTITPGTGANHDRGSRTYTAMWQADSTGGDNPGGNTGGNSGGNNSSSVAPTPSEPVTVTTTNRDGSTTVTTTTPEGLVSAVTTGKDGGETAVIQVPQNSPASVDAVMPSLTVSEDATPVVTIENATGRPVSVTVPFSGSGTVVAVRQEKDGSETIVPFSVVDENGLRIKTQPGAESFRLVDNKKTFVDVPDSHWAASFVDFVASRELFRGTSDTTFAPSGVMNRAMMTTVLWRLAEQPGSALDTLFDDVVPGSYYEQAAAWGAATGIVKGTDVGFEPDTPVTRETLAVLLYRTAGSPTVVDELPHRFADGAQVADWAEEAMIWCIQNDIIRGRDGDLLAPKDVATRAEVATMLQRFIAQQV